MARDTYEHGRQAGFDETDRLKFMVVVLAERLAERDKEALEESYNESNSVADRVEHHTPAKAIETDDYLDIMIRNNQEFRRAISEKELETKLKREFDRVVYTNAVDRISEIFRKCHRRTTITNLKRRRWTPNPPS